MSMKNVKKFMELVKAEESLAKRMVALKDGLQEGEFHFKNDKEFVEKKILPLAKEYGIEFSVEDFIEFTNSQLTSLSEDELAEISGGFPGVALLTFLTLGIGVIMPSAAQKVANIVVGSPASTMQSVTADTSDNADTDGLEKNAGFADIAAQDRFNKAEKTIIGRINEKFHNMQPYMDPALRLTWLKTNIENLQEDINSSGKKAVVVYNTEGDRFWIKSSDGSHRNLVPEDISQKNLKKKLSENLLQQYNEAYSGNTAQLAQQWNNLNQQWQQMKNSLNQDYSIDQYQQSIEVCKQNINSLISQLKPYLPSFTLNMDTTNFNNIKNYLITKSANYYATQINWIDQIIRQQELIAQYRRNISTVKQLTGQSKELESKMNGLYGQWQSYGEKQKAFNENMKTEFNYFFGELYSALKGDTEIAKLAEAAKTADAKITLANEIKKTADKIIKEKLQDQLLVGCEFEFVQTDLMFDIKVHYNNQGWHSTFSVDDFISKQNHLEIINSEANKKCDEVAKKLAEYIQRTFTAFEDGAGLKRMIRSVLAELKAGKLNDLDLGIQIVNSDDKQVTFSSASGDQQRNTILTIERIADEFNKMVNMQAMEATRQQNEGTIEYTPFGRKLWNSIGSQAQHVLDTLNKINDLSDVQDREAFEDDLKYVAGQITEITRGTVNKLYLVGAHRNDYSFNKEDLQKIQKFAKMIKNDN